MRRKPLLWTILIMALPVVGQESASVARGELIFRATGGCSCHTDVAAGGAPMAGGRRLATPFGAVFSTNITPEPDTGIGKWSDDDFVDAMTRGLAPDGTHYFPVFPFTSFTRMRREDLLDLRAYLSTLPAVHSTTPPPDMPPPFRWRSLLGLWKELYLTPGPFEPIADSSDVWNRGAYLVTALSHCGECHSPRDVLGGVQDALAFAGTINPDGVKVPNITPDLETGIGNWTEADLVWYLQTGLEPDGDTAQGIMLEVIEEGYQYLSKDDLRAIAVYLRTRRPIHRP